MLWTRSTTAFTPPPRSFEVDNLDSIINGLHPLTKFIFSMLTHSGFHSLSVVCVNRHLHNPFHAGSRSGLDHSRHTLLDIHRRLSELPCDGTYKICFSMVRVLRSSFFFFFSMASATSESAKTLRPSIFFSFRFSVPDGVRKHTMV